MDRDQMIDQIVYKYLGSVKGASDAYRNDAQYHASIRIMAQMLGIFDLAMEQEGLLGRTRWRILERIMMAAPDPNEALRRIEIMKNVNINPDWLRGN